MKTDLPGTPVAHTPNEKGELHLLKDHLRGVTGKARGFGSTFYAGNPEEKDP